MEHLFKLEKWLLGEIEDAAQLAPFASAYNDGWLNGLKTVLIQVQVAIACDRQWQLEREQIAKHIAEDMARINARAEARLTSGRPLGDATENSQGGDTRHVGVVATPAHQLSSRD